jgi:hypothetical protein
MRTRREQMPVLLCGSALNLRNAPRPSIVRASLRAARSSLTRSIGVLDSASHALTLYARRALMQTVQNLTSGAWTFRHGAGLDAQVAERMTADLALLPPD